MTVSSRSRRALLRPQTALHMLNGDLPAWMPRLTFAPKYENPAGDVLISIFLRGGADALNMIVPHGDDNYYTARPQLAIPRPDERGSDPKTIDLDGFFGLHPNMEALEPVFRAGEIAAIHATGSPDPTRSHFRAMDYMERGTPGQNQLSTGWVARHLATLDTGNRSPLRAVGWGTSIPAQLRGPVTAVAIKSIVDYHLGGREEAAEPMLETLNALYSLGDDEIARAAQQTKETIDMVQQVGVAQYRARSGALYPESEFGLALLQTAALLRADVGLETVCIDAGGWDTHFAQGSTQGEFANLVTDLAQGLAAFHEDMGPDMENVTVVVMSEFGRRLAENASRGTDHGHGGAMLVMSGSLQADPVVADWPGLDLENLDDGDLSITTDYRDVLSEIIRLRLNNPGVADVFPDFEPAPVGLFGSSGA